MAIIEQNRLKPLSILTSPIRLLMADPRISGPLLAAILYYPDKLQSIIPAQLFPYLTSTAFVGALKFFLGLGVVRRLSSKFSQIELNNRKGAAKFVKNQELVLISGGASGIGKLMAEGFAGLGVKVVIVDLNPPKETLPSGITFYQLDVTQPKKIAEVATLIRSSHGDPTVLINNAGIALCQTILDGTEEGIRRTFEVNTMSHFWMVREFLPAMAKRDHGHVVTLASLASYIVHAQNVDYCCTKASALAFHEGLASELKHRYNAPNVKTTTVHPTWIRTPLIEAITTNPAFKDRVIEPDYVATEIVKQVVSGRSAQLILPPEMSFLTTLRSWPSWLQEGLRNKIGPVLAIYKG